MEFDAEQTCLAILILLWTWYEARDCESIFRAFLFILSSLGKIFSELKIM